MQPGRGRRERAADLTEVGVQQPNGHGVNRAKAFGDKRVGRRCQLRPRSVRRPAGRPDRVPESEDHPLFYPASAASGARHIEGVRRHGRPSDHVGCGRRPFDVAPGVLVDRFGQTQIGEPVKGRDHVVDRALQAPLVSFAGRPAATATTTLPGASSSTWAIRQPLVTSRDAAGAAFSPVSTRSGYCRRSS